MLERIIDTVGLSIGLIMLSSLTLGLFLEENYYRIACICFRIGLSSAGLIVLFLFGLVMVVVWTQ